ncbi:hypothetical protein [Ktedonobacter sp. SOSP1-52]|uniref:hypothetical protein n=1 Tax=Ktedonobacter sp. SOSP1-52 TaxID=2778366 RepID=UPI00191518AD|nr:hypothetical protein [Ktedonobacter sp. SOSP1-52]
MIRQLGFHNDPAEQEERHLALQTVTQAALARLEELKLEGAASIETIEHLRAYYEKKLGVLTQDTEEARQHQRQRRSTLQQLSHDIHQALIGLRNSGVIDDGVFHSVEHDLDLEDERLRGR